MFLMNFFHFTFSSAVEINKGDKHCHWAEGIYPCGYADILFVEIEGPGSAGGKGSVVWGRQES